MENPGKTLNVWARKQHTYLPKAMKTCKLLTSVVTDRTYSHLKQNDFFLLEQKGSKRGSYDCKLMINKIKLEDCKKWKQNLIYSWID